MAELRPSAQVNEAGLLAPRDDADAKADLVEDPLDELAAVSGLAHGARRDGTDARDPVPLGDALERSQCADTAVHGAFLQAAGR